MRLGFYGAIVYAYLPLPVEGAAAAKSPQANASKPFLIHIARVVSAASDDGHYVRPQNGP